jgi:RNA polymerase sigma-70 factor (ECF subfamily)
MERNDEQVLDELLVLECKTGDQEALKQLVDRWQPRLLRYAFRLTHSQDAVPDIVQEAWMAIVKGLKKLDDPARFRPWAYRITTRKSIDWIHRQQRKRSLEQSVVPEPSSERSNPNDDLGRMQEALAALPEEERHLLLLHYVEGLAIGEIAEVLAIPAGTVKSRLFYTRKKLKNQMERKQS